MVHGSNDSKRRGAWSIHRQKSLSTAQTCKQSERSLFKSACKMRTCAAPPLASGADRPGR
jgi:hypothetical protein